MSQDTSQLTIKQRIISQIGRLHFVTKRLVWSIADPHVSPVGLLTVQDIQEVTLKDRFGVHIGPSSDFSDIQAGMSEIETKSDHPKFTLDVSNAATTVIHTL